MRIFSFSLQVVWVLGSLLLVAAPLPAEVITIPVGGQGGNLSTLPRPARGMSSAAVLERFGEPLSMTPASGEPPISRWQYENFTVYFESDTVIHSVLPHVPLHPVTE